MAKMHRLALVLAAAAAGAEQRAPACTDFQADTSRHHGDQGSYASSAGDCCARCESVATCQYWTFCAAPFCAVDECGGKKGAEGGCCHAEAGGTIPPTVCKGRTSGRSPSYVPTPPPLPPPPLPAPVLPPAGAPNVLFIAVDDLRPQLGAYGHADTLTPHLDGFASSALLFANAHAQIAHCSPSRNSLMSGRTPDHVKVWNFIDDFRSPTVGGGATVTLPEYFRFHGFFTTGAGKCRLYYSHNFEKRPVDCTTFGDR